MSVRHAAPRAASSARAPKRPSYDLHLRALAQRDRRSYLLRELRVPRSTIDSWRRRGLDNVVWLHDERAAIADLAEENARLRARLAVLRALLSLVLITMRIVGLRLDSHRVTSFTDKRLLIKAMERARRAVGLTKACALVGLSPSRFHAWNSHPLCQLDDRPSCPRSRPLSLLRRELQAIEAYATSPALAHHSVRTLALLAQRAGDVAASLRTWQKVIHDRGLRRPRLREIDVRPRLGIRASAVNEIWHVDAMRIVLVDGSRVYLQVVLDNFSRFVLAWSLAPSADGAGTLQLLQRARRHLLGSEHLPQLVSDNGSENIAAADAVGTVIARHIVAQIDIIASNSMVEAFFRMLRQYLRRQTLPDVSALYLAMQTYVRDYNTAVPKHVLGGRTSHEVFHGLAATMPDELRGQRRAAREERLRLNREASCGVCPHKDSS